MNNDQKNTNKIAALVLYILGTAIFFYSFDWFFQNSGTPWWIPTAPDNSTQLMEVVNADL